MGRVKQRMELISNEKARYVTFQKRKKGLKKKAYELKTLCDVEVCLIIYEPKVLDRATDVVEIWPPNPNDIRRLIDSYKNEASENQSKRTVDLSNFFKDRNQKIEDMLEKLKKKNDKARYPTWDKSYNNLSVEELRGFEGILEGQLADVKARLEFMKGPQNMAALGTLDHSLFKPISVLNPYEVDHIPMIQYPNLNQTQMQGLELDTNSLANPIMMMPMNYNSHFTQLGRSFYFDTMMPEMMMENMAVFNNPSPNLGYTNTQAMLPYPQYCAKNTESASSQVPASQMDEYYEESKF